MSYFEQKEYTDNNLKAVLKECNKYAKTGYKIAYEQAKNLNNTLYIAEEKIKETIIDFNCSNCYSPETSELLENQLIEIRDSFEELSFSFMEDLNNLKENMSKFSVTLFGRTMAGKSTLMEILTEGNGESIGKGSQRTTRDIRKYIWNNLEITDVPGIGAFEGDEDEQIAFEAAKMADLILFLITDDGPQASEAECFSKIINLGKPVICILNVKSSLSESKNIKLGIRDIKKRFNMENLNAIRNQFLAFAEKYGQSWNHVPFVYVHLKAAYVSNHMNDAETAKLLYNESKIEYLKNKIIKQVLHKGRFYREKTFIDIISNPAIDSIQNLLEHSQINSVQGRTLVEKKRKLELWKTEFEKESINRIESFAKKIRGELNTGIASFVEEHFDDKDADKEWQKIINDMRIQDRCIEFLEELEERCNEKLMELSREITNELKFSSAFTNDKSLRMNRIVDGQKICNWATVIIGGGLGAVAGIAYLFGAAVSGPLGWAALAVSIIGSGVSLLFKSRSKKEKEAKTKLEKILRETVNKIDESIISQLREKLSSLIEIRITGLLKEIDKLNSVIFSLADTQKDLAWKLNNHLLDLNRQIVNEALSIVGGENEKESIIRVARIPGNTSLLMLRDGITFSSENRDKIHFLMSERIAFVYESVNKKTIISRILGKKVDRNKINVEGKIGIAHIILDDDNPEIRNRVCMAQQLTELLIVNN